MNTSRLDHLLNFYQEDPQDPFNAYALALEYSKYSTTQAKSYFELLLKDFPEYLPTYYHAAQFFYDLEEIETARDVYQKGIDLADKQRNSKTLEELKRALRALEDDV
ncbi:tetratricopeptide repeat protein [Arundinibacter roseus]|uniref:Tetratricopeptide repeat protein n=1 Tax=Arundinibacter roseus TaxID=2070510 RepID=A0A4R4K9P5_9BACT|nr:tetratricopeptide repeat protein [Arundinibacter roseus]TDB64468.1 tetratricopeptide repeat protein [Arundinibacter roseus]